MCVYIGWPNFLHSLHRIYSGCFELASVSFQLPSENTLLPNIPVLMWPFWRVELPGLFQMSWTFKCLSSADIWGGFVIFWSKLISQWLCEPREQMCRKDRQG